MSPPMSGSSSRSSRVAPHAGVARSPVRGHGRRIPAVGLLLAGTVLLAVVLGRFGDSPYEVHARFANAGQLVKGGNVEVAGQKIGSIQKITIADDGHADVRMSITEDRFIPFREGTRVAVRSVGQATITNRYVDVGTAPDNAPAIPDGGTLPATAATGIVDLDEILNAVDAPTRKQIQGLIANSADVYAGSGAPAFNRMLAKLDPATATVAGLLQELAQDKQQITDLVSGGARAASAVASRNADLEASLTNTADLLGQLAVTREELSSTLQRTPAVLRQARGTLANVSSTVTELRPALREVPPAQPQLRRILRRLPRGLDSAAPALDETAALLRPARTALSGFRKLEKPMNDALRLTSDGLGKATPVLEGLRFFGSDLLLGVVNGLTGLAGGPYNQQGHYIKASFVQNAQTIGSGVIGGFLPSLTGETGIAPGLFNAVIGQTKRCPGSGAPPAPDGSSPWYPKEGICDPLQQVAPGINSPTSTCVSALQCTDGPVPSRRKGSK